MRRGGVARRVAEPARMEPVFGPGELAGIYEREASLLWWARPALAEVREIVELQAELFGAERLGLRVALTDRPMCPGFHVDRVYCRLIVALAGEGTQWRREPVSAGPDAGEVHQLATGAIGLFKGTAWEGSVAVVHRSPPTAPRRLVLTVDLL